MLFFVFADLSPSHLTRAHLPKRSTHQWQQWTSSEDGGGPFLHAGPAQGGVVIVPADKGRAAVVLDRSTYDQKVDSLLSDDFSQTNEPTNSYREILIRPWRDA